MRRELVDIFGAVMYHRNPVRTVTVMEHPDLPPEAVGIELQPGMDITMLPPEQVQIIELASQEQQRKKMRASAAMILEKYLNWTPQELDLKRQGQKWVREALIKGMGVMWTEMVGTSEAPRRRQGCQTRQGAKGQGGRPEQD